MNEMEFAKEMVRIWLKKLQPHIGEFSYVDAPFILFAIDAYREEIVRRIPEAEKVNEDLKNVFLPMVMKQKCYKTDDGTKVRVTMKRRGK